MPVVLILTALTSLVRLCSNDGGDFFLQYADQRLTYRLPQPLSDQLLKRFLTSLKRFAIVCSKGHWYSPGSLTDNWVPVQDTSLLHFPQFSVYCPITPSRQV